MSKNFHLLPNKYKNLSLIGAIVFFVGLLISLAVGQVIKTDTQSFIIIFRDLLLVTLLLFAFSKEHNETQRIQRLRIRKLFAAIAFAVLSLILKSFYYLFFGTSQFEVPSGFDQMFLILVFYLATFHYERVFKS